MWHATDGIITFTHIPGMPCTSRIAVDARTIMLRRIETLYRRIRCRIHDIGCRHGATHARFGINNRVGTEESVLIVNETKASPGIPAKVVHDGNTPRPAPPRTTGLRRLPRTAARFRARVPIAGSAGVRVSAVRPAAAHAPRFHGIMGLTNETRRPHRETIPVPAVRPGVLPGFDTIHRAGGGRRLRPITFTWETRVLRARRRYHLLDHERQWGARPVR